ncbi:MAG: ral secretory pathway protein type pilus assembly protein PilB [Candidatus Saccharibacteria bacterium]|nr:ral secretory pathway protein type pilus assembly protein PilB [Candidatus Saccharibacteria bacterium]
MRIPDSLVEKLLNHSGKFTKEQITGLRQKEADEKKPLQDLVIKENLLTEKELTKMYADEIEVPFVELNAKEIKHEILKLLPERIARQYNAVVFGVEEKGTKLIAVEDPDDIQALNFLQKQLGTDIKVHITTSSLLQAALDQYRGNISSELTKVIAAEDAAEEIEDVDESEVAEDSPVAQTVNIIIEYGVKAGASDIHIEPREDYVVVRYRIDGLLREANKLPRKLLGALVSRIKILSNLKIDEHRAPQDGRFKVEVSGQLYALRVSTLPILDGEKVVMRILNESSKPADFTELGFWGSALLDLKQAIIQPHGMVLVTGPTGSGKSTTLFSVLSSLNTPNVNISTVEDPIEYHVVGANQVQVNPIAGMTFTNGLRALLRQDPNIIMVGEVRDGETADLAIQAALTGHLVFSTLHTNNAATCLPRLLDMGVEPFLIASTVRIVVAQRLVRRLCIDCREAFEPDAVVVKEIEKMFKLSDNGGIKRMHELEESALKDSIGKSTTAKASPTDSLSTSATAIQRLFKAHNDGCDACNHTGYKGRIGIYEILNNTTEIQKSIVTSAASEVIENQAIAEGMITMQLDGFIKALRGQTTIEEILRVTAQE